MTTHQTLTGYLLVGALSIGLVAYSVQAIASQEGQPQQTVPLTTLLAEQEKTNAMSKEMVQMRLQIAQAPYMCLTTVEKANPTKKLDPQTFVLSEKPPVEATSPVAPKP